VTHCEAFARNNFDTHVLQVETLEQLKATRSTNLVRVNGLVCRGVNIHPISLRSRENGNVGARSVGAERMGRKDPSSGSCQSKDEWDGVEEDRLQRGSVQGNLGNITLPCDIDYVETPGSW
jgi:hypothetical protein